MEEKSRYKIASELGAKRLGEIKEERIYDYYLEPNRCKFCDEPIRYEYKRNVYCNSSCAAKYNNSKRKHTEITKEKISKKLKGRKLTQEQKDKISGKGNGKWKDGSRIRDFSSKICLMCGIKFKPTLLKNNGISRNKFCSDICRNKNVSNVMKERIKNGLHLGWKTRNITSYPEKFFIKVLENNNIKYSHNYPVNKRDLGLNDSCNYFLDFYITDKKIDLEIDGAQHKFRKEHDDLRDNILTQNGYIVYRIKWKNINTENGKKYIKNEIDKFLEFYENS